MRCRRRAWHSLTRFAMSPSRGRVRVTMRNPEWERPGHLDATLDAQPQTSLLPACAVALTGPCGYVCADVLALYDPYRALSCLHSRLSGPAFFFLDRSRREMRQLRCLLVFSSLSGSCPRGSVQNRTFLKIGSTLFERFYKTENCRCSRLFILRF